MIFGGVVAESYYIPFLQKDKQRKVLSAAPQVQAPHSGFKLSLRSIKIPLVSTRSAAINLSEQICSPRSLPKGRRSCISSTAAADASLLSDESDLFRTKPPRIYKLKSSLFDRVCLAIRTRDIDRVDVVVKNRQMEMIHLLETSSTCSSTITTTVRVSRPPRSAATW